MIVRHLFLIKRRDWSLMETKAEIQEKFGRALLKVMEEKGLSIRKLALASGLEYAHVQRITKGKVNAELTTILALCKGLAITSEQFFAIFDNI